MRSKLFALAGVSLIAVVGAAVAYATTGKTTPAPTEGYVCPVTGETLPCPDCCPLNANQTAQADCCPDDPCCSNGHCCPAAKPAAKKFCPPCPFCP